MRLPSALLRRFAWAGAIALVAPLAFGVTPPSTLELPEVVVRGIDTVRLEAQRRGVLPLEAPRVAQAKVRVDLPAGTLPSPKLRSAPPVRSPGCAYRNPVTAAIARTATGPEGLYRSAQQDLADGRLESAAYYLAQIRSEHPEHARADDAAFWLGEINRRQDRDEEAVAFFRLVEGDFAPEASYRLAWLLADGGREDAARRAWTAVAGTDSPHRAEALYHLGTLRRDGGDLAGALEAFREVLRLAEAGESVPPDVRAASLLALGLTLRESGQPGDAEDVLVRFLLGHPEHPSAPTARVVLAWALLEEGRPREAALRFAWLADAAPPPEVAVRTLYGLVRARADLGDAEGAAQALGPLEAEAPRGPWVGWARADLGWLAFREGRYDDAARRYQSALAAWDGPGAHVPRYMAAESLYLSGRYDEALVAFQTLDPGSPLFPTALHRAGLSALMAGRPAVAAELFRTVLDQHPGYPQTDRVRAWLGEALLRLQQPEAARRAFEAVPDESPAHGQALYGRAWIAFEGGRWDEAARLFERFLRAHPADPNADEALLALARAHFNRRKLPPALEALATLERDARDPELRAAARFYRGWMLARSGRSAAAREILESLRADDPGSPYAPRALHALAWLDFAAGDYARAAERFAEVAETARDEALREEALQKRADSLYNLGRHEAALRAYRALGETPEARYGAALSLDRLGRTRELAAAAEAFAKQYPQDPRAADLFLSLARELAETGRTAAAAEAFREAASRSGDPARAAEARLEEARSLAAAGRTADAIAVLQELAQEGPLGTAALRELAALAEEEGGPSAALSAWDRLAGRVEGEERAEALRRAARWARTSLDWSGARRRLDQALSAAPEGAEILRQALLADLGELLLLEGRPGEAQAPLTRAAEAGLSPEGLRAFHLLGQAQEAAGRSQEALETYLRIGYLYDLEETGAAEALLRAGHLLEEAGQPGRARAVYEKVAEEAGSGPAAEAGDRLSRLPSP